MPRSARHCWISGSRRTTALANFADGLSLIGNFERAAAFHSALLAFDLPRKFEAKVHLALARDYAAQGDVDSASAQIDKAEQADPDNKDAGVLRSQLSR